MKKITVDTEVKNVWERYLDYDLNTCLRHHESFRIGTDCDTDTLELFILKKGKFVKYWDCEHGLII
ncbi:hypothetical protein JTF04_11610 [Mammaliicoccus vitulinus]|uniref:hypothetical protein n=1 Tax=Mammaliicoccus vitulinus TaxID=71237 RepID=UPI00195226BB|nr:hypothetical protein [Mammaliicoccus vitulinus]MBM6630333.1 hypothetical protein [Mammaliicoccus vitulinus]